MLAFRGSQQLIREVSELKREFSSPGEDRENERTVNTAEIQKTLGRLTDCLPPLPPETGLYLNPALKGTCQAPEVEAGRGGREESDGTRKGQRTLDPDDSQVHLF